MSGQATIVVGGSRGLGRGITTAFARAGFRVVAVARTEMQDPEPAGAPNGAGGILAVTADAGDASVVSRLLDRYEPQNIIVVAGAIPQMRPLHEQTWESFSLIWEVDVRIAFEWLRASLRKPLGPGSRVVVFSSGAAINPAGSPLSGGYAGAKATQRFMASYAQDEANRAGFDINFTAVLPQFAPMTGVGEVAVRAYAARAGLSIEEFLAGQAFPLLTPAIAGAALVELVQRKPEQLTPAYLLNGGGLRELP